MSDTPPEKEESRDAAVGTGADEPKSGGKATSLPREIGGRKGPEPTRYGDWEKKGIISDF